ncbi:hypothetical protein I302_108498 [Kwoniella bestiolae CBS 10118]|uniref:N-acetyltransferase domain-containing protein n=1 Tax=Kwoniella bestiolae CBS 10118 TaxID=1296100 RepID=A0A1B9FVJ3_9TREE|nr:hypothetical protein I302_07126 [Kwoniella bestiolae CBS 10118]OCF22785.1 hypothetical protein I302_07126 [Kwoniella bestiolae CBS 10118]
MEKHHLVSEIPPVGSKNPTSQEIARRARVVIEKVSAEEVPLIAPRLSAIVHQHMSLDISTYFTHPYTLTDSLKLFNSISPLLIPPSSAPSFPPPPGGIVMFVARLLPSEPTKESIDMEGNFTTHSEIVGSVQLQFASMPNGAFRSEVKKMLVDTRYGGRGIGKGLLRALEEEARRWGSTTCMLDTEQDSLGEKLYRSCGWTQLGVLPKFHWPPDKSEKRATVFYYKHLDDE